MRLILLVAIVSSSLLHAAEEKKKELKLPTWSARQTAYAKKASEKLDALPGEDPRKALKQYLEFLQKPDERNAERFVDALADAREKAKKPLTGIGLFNGDPLLCNTPACGESLGYLSDKHLTPLLKQAFPPAIAVAIAAFAAAAKLKQKADKQKN